MSTTLNDRSRRPRYSTARQDTKEITTFITLVKSVHLADLVVLLVV